MWILNECLMCLSPRVNINKHPDPRVNLSVQYKVFSFFSRKWIWEKFWWPEQSGRCGVVFSSLLSCYQSALFVCIHDYCSGGGIKPRKEKYIVQCTSKVFLAQMSAIPLKRLSKILKYECYGKEGVENALFFFFRKNDYKGLISTKKD